jgi:acyl carrier protein
MGFLSIESGNMPTLNMQTSEIRESIIGLLREITGDEGFPETIDDEIAISEQMKLDSMDFLDLVIEIKKAMRIDIPEEEYGRLKSVGAMVSYLSCHLPAHH